MTVEATPGPGAQPQDAPGGQQPKETPPPEGQAPKENETPPKTYDEAYVKELRQSEAKTRTRLKQLESEAEQLRQANMSADEKALAEAKQSGRSEAAAEFGKRLARTEFDALAGRRNPEAKTDELLEFVDMAKFVGDDGEPDTKAIQAAVERLVPAPSNAPPGFDGGQRTPGQAPSNFSDVIRSAARR